MNEKDRILNIVFNYLKEDGATLESINELDKYEESLTRMVKDNWASKNDFFNDLANICFEDKLESKD
jgi:hypothetical protein